MIAVFIIVTVVLYVVTGILIVKGKNKLKHFAECSGTIKEIYENTSALRTGNTGHKAVSPVVSYTVNGVDYTFMGNYYSTSMKIGQKVKVLYSRDDFSKATMKSGVYVAPMITGALAVAFTFPIIIIIILHIQGII